MGMGQGGAGDPCFQARPVCPRGFPEPGLSHPRDGDLEESPSSAHGKFPNPIHGTSHPEFGDFFRTEIWNLNIK